MNNKVDNTQEQDSIFLIKKAAVKSKHFLKKALELWDEAGYDNENGGYVEALDFDSNPLTTLPRRFRVQPRTIFAHAAGTAWGYYDGIKPANNAFQHIIDTQWLSDGGFATLSDYKGKILDKSVFTYDHAFVLLGLGWLYKVSGNLVSKTYLYDTWNMLNARLVHLNRGYITSIPAPLSGPKQLQNPHMHMLEAVLNLVELFGEDIWRQAARDLYSLFIDYFVLPHEGKLREFFNDNWQADALQGHLLEPGHHYEWIWLLQKYETIMNEEVFLFDTLYAFAKQGTSERGLGFNQTDFDGHPTNSNHRMWIQTEKIKAQIAMYRRSKSISMLLQAYEALEVLFEYYLIEKKSVWYDEVDSEGNNISSNAPTSTLYHLIIALHEYIQIAHSV